ncbi:MAG: hypothetical protein FJ119_09005 [Deltaproteobacteria bacterium]|nr:hypothetical protein [Deltaproteobacteria bacterium]
MSASKPLTSTGQPLFYLLFGGLIVLHVALMWSCRLYPFVDVPNHLGLATVYRHYDEPSNHFNEFYALDVTLKPNTLHLFFVSLKMFPSVEFGNKVFFCLYAALFPLSVLFAIRMFGGNPWFAFLSFLFLYNYNVAYGFVGFTIAVPFVVVLFALLPGYCSQLTLLRGLAGAGLLVALFFMHALAALFAAFVFFLCMISHSNTLQDFLKKIIAVLPLAILILFWWINDSRVYEGPGLFQFIADYYRNDYVDSLLLRGGLFIFDNYALYEGLAGYAVAAFFSLSVVLMVVLVCVFRKQSLFSAPAGRCLRISLLCIACSGLCFLLIPLHLPGYSFLIQRFSVFFFLSAIIWGSILARQHTGRALCGFVVFAALVHFCCWADYVRDFNRVNAGFAEDFFASVDKRKIMTSLISDNSFRGRPVYRQFVDYFIVWNKGIATTRLLDERSFALRRKGALDSLPSFLKLKTFNDVSSLGTIDYILVRGNIPLEFNHLRNSFFVEKNLGIWALYKKY